MQEIRRRRLEAVILEELSQVVPRELKDPRIPNVTFTACEVTQDGSHATVYFSILGGAQAGFDGAPPLSENGAKARMQDCIDGLTAAQGYLRRHLARVLTVRHVPTMIFKEDRGLENAAKVFNLLKQLENEKSEKSSK